YSDRHLYIVNPGDSIEATITVEKNNTPQLIQLDSEDSICLNCISYSYTGEGSGKFNCKEKIERIQLAADIKWHQDISNGLSDNNELKYIRSYFEEKDSTLQVGVSILKEYRAKLEPVIYKMMQADLI